MGRAKSTMELEEEINPDIYWQEVLHSRKDWATLHLDKIQLGKPSLEVIDWIGPRASLAFAMALEERKEGLYFGLHAIGNRDRSYFFPEQVFLHNSKWAYDALGRHRMPYVMSHRHSHTDYNLTFNQASQEIELPDSEEVARASEALSLLLPNWRKI